MAFDELTKSLQFRRSMEGSFFTMVASKFNYSFQVSANNGVARKLANGSWTGVVDVLMHGRADIAGSLLCVPERQLDLAMLPYTVSPITFATRPPTPKQLTHLVIQPLDGVVWLLLILSFLLFAKAIAICKKCNFSEAFFTALCAFLNQSEYKRGLTVQLQIVNRTCN